MLQTVDGLVYVLEQQVIVALIPRPSVLPVLVFGLQQTEKWEQREGGFWSRAEYWPSQRDLTTRHLPPPAHPSISPAQREEAITRLQQPEMSIRKVASRLGTSRGTIQRLVEQEGIERQTSQKLSPEQREEAFRFLDEGVSLR